MFDTHLHTIFSTDADMKVEDAIKKANELDIGLIITEHLDLEYPENPDDFIFNISDYFKILGPFRNDKLLLGVELGLRENYHEENALLIKGWPFDQIIGSIHVVDNIDIYRKEYTTNTTKKVSYGRYLSSMLECILNFKHFDTLGHIDYISRYAVYDDPEIYLSDFYDEWTAICKALVEKDKVIEINTRRLHDERAVNALIDLYKHYKENGGKYVTIGSDAHRTKAIAVNFDKAWEIAEHIGLQPVYFKERKMFFDVKK